MLIQRIADWWYRVTLARAMRLWRKAYPDREESAIAMLGQAAQDLEIVATGQGWVVGAIEVCPSTDEDGINGYEVSIVDSVEVWADDVE